MRLPRRMKFISIQTIVRAPRNDVLEVSLVCCIAGPDYTHNPKSRFLTFYRISHLLRKRLQNAALNKKC
jgi:hypothetical protein